MNAERLHALAIKLLDELEATNVKDSLEEILSALQQTANAPNAAAQQNLADAVTHFRNGIRHSTLPKWSPAWLELLDEIGYRNQLGDALLAGVNSILTRNEITYALARTELKEITTRLISLKKALEALTEAFTILHIDAEELAPGESEVGVLIPRGSVHNQLNEFADELKELNFIVRTVREVATGETGPVELRTISSSDFFVFITENPITAALLATIVERLIRGYKNILQVRKLHGELAEQMGKKNLKEVEGYAENKMLGTIKAIADDVIKKYPTNDPGRKNELRVSLDLALRKLADRIDRGFNIEIRIEPLPEPRPTEEGSDVLQSDDYKKHLEYRKAVEGAAEQLEFVHRMGPPILHLEDKGTSAGKARIGNSSPDS